MPDDGPALPGAVAAAAAAEGLALPSPAAVVGAMAALIDGLRSRDRIISELQYELSRAHRLASGKAVAPGQADFAELLESGVRWRDAEIKRLQAEALLNHGLVRIPGAPYV